MDASFARVWLRIEGFAVFIAAVCAYAHFNLNWMWFAVLLLAPDLSMLGYLGGPRIGATLYNLGHTYASALLVLCAGLGSGMFGHPRLALLGIGLIWCAHIGMDRAIGYGLKSAQGFQITHLGPIGRSR